MNILLQLLFLFLIAYALIATVIKFTKVYYSHSTCKIEHREDKFVLTEDVRSFFLYILLVAVLIEFILIVFIFLNPNLLYVEFVRHFILLIQASIFILFLKIKDKIYV